MLLSIRTMLRASRGLRRRDAPACCPGRRGLDLAETWSTPGLTAGLARGSWRRRKARGSARATPSWCSRKQLQPAVRDPCGPASSSARSGCRPTSALTPPGGRLSGGSSSAPRRMIFDDRFAEHAAVRRGLCGLEQSSIWHRSASPRSGRGYEDLIAGRDARSIPTSNPGRRGGRDDPCWFFYTSGTTGRPKAAVLTHGQLGLRHQQSPGRPHARHDGHGTTPRWWSRRCRTARACTCLCTQVARGTPPVLLASESASTAQEAWRLVEDAPGHQHVHRADHPDPMLVQDPGGGRATTIPRCATSSMPARRCTARTRRSRRCRRSGKVIVQYYGLGEVTGEHHRAAAPRRTRPGRRRHARSAPAAIRAPAWRSRSRAPRAKRLRGRRNRRDLRARPGGLRRLSLNNPGGQRQGA